MAIYELRQNKCQMIPAHSNGITALAFSPEGKYLASYSNGDNRMSFWQTSTGQYFFAIKNYLLFIYIFIITTFLYSFICCSPIQKYIGMFGLGQSQTRCVKGYSTAPMPDVSRLNPMRLAKLIWINNRTVSLMLADGSETRFNV